MDADTTQAAWFALELEQREQFEREQKMLRDDLAYEQWLEQLNYRTT